MLAVAAAIAVALLAGLLYAVLATIGDTRSGTTSQRPVAFEPSASAGASGAIGSSTVEQDALAARPMLQLPASAANPQPLVSATAGPPISLPAATDSTQLVPTGFPHTPEGALAQLAAIDTMALRDANPAQVRAVHDWAAAPGAVDIAHWNMTVAVTAVLTGAGQPAGAADVRSTFTPLAGQIKGSLGPDFAVVCVLGEWSVTYRSASQAGAGAGDCQRMVWSAGRWRIGPGPQPAYAPSAWPGSADAVRAGWRSLTDA